MALLHVPQSLQAVELKSVNNFQHPYWSLSRQWSDVRLRGVGFLNTDAVLVTLSQMEKSPALDLLMETHHETLAPTL